MRILLVAPDGGEIGGVASVIGNLSRSLQRQGHEVSLFYTGPSTFLRTKTTKAGLPAFELNLQMPFGTRNPILSLILFLIRFPLAMYQMIRLIKRQKIQIVNIHYPADIAWYFALCRKLLSFALVTSVHGADLFPGGREKEKYSWAIRFLLNISDRIVAPSRGFQQDVVRVFSSLKDKIVFIHNGVNLAELYDSYSETVPHFDDPYLLCIAMHNPKKGLDVLLRAFALIQDSHQSLKLVLAGDGPLRSELETLASALGIRDKVHFLGKQGRAVIVKLIKGCELFVLPSRSEPFGLVLAEAMAFKKPVVATTVGGIPEIIRNGVDGILVEPDKPSLLAEAVLKILRDQQLRQSLASSGYTTVTTHFNSEKTALSYESLFSHLVNALKVYCPSTSFAS